MAFTWSWKGCCRDAPGDITVTRTWLTGEAWPTGYGAHAPKSRQGGKLCERFVRAIAT